MSQEFERSQYNLKSFLESIKDKDYPDIIDATDKEIYRVERLSSGTLGAVRARELGSVKYMNYLKEFLFFMRTGIKPAGVFEHNFQLYKLVVQSLIDKGQFKKEALGIFDESK